MSSMKTLREHAEEAAEANAAVDVLRTLENEDCIDNSRIATVTFSYNKLYESVCKRLGAEKVADLDSMLDLFDEVVNSHGLLLKAIDAQFVQIRDMRTLSGRRHGETLRANKQANDREAGFKAAIRVIIQELIDNN